MEALLSGEVAVGEEPGRDDSPGVQQSADPTGRYIHPHCRGSGRRGGRTRAAARVTVILKNLGDEVLRLDSVEKPINERMNE